jgi:hypothetical protein
MGMGVEVWLIVRTKTFCIRIKKCVGSTPLHHH